MHRKLPILVAAFACFIFLSLSLSTPALASDPVYGPGNTIMAVICVEANGYKDYVPHYNDHFPPGSTVKIYVEASGKTKKDNVTGEYIPSVRFKMSGTRPTGATFTASITSSKLINHDSTLYKETYGIISISIPENAAIGDYEFYVEATDNNEGGELIGRTPSMHFYVYEDATPPPVVTPTPPPVTPTPTPITQGGGGGGAPPRDSDGDGYSDIDEMLAGTDPNDQNDYPGAPTPTPQPVMPTPMPVTHGGGGGGAPTLYPTPVPTSPNLQISVTPNPVEAGKTVTIRVKDNGWGVEGANVYYAQSTIAIKTGRDVVINGEYIGTTSEGGWLSYSFDKSGIYAIGVTYNRLYNPSIEHLTVTAPTPTPIPIPVATPTPPPVLPIPPEYLYVIPIALFLILLPFIFHIRGKRKKPAITPEMPPPSPEQKIKEEQITPPISESITIERAIYDPCKRDFVERPLPHMKEWINRYDPGAYWFAMSIQNNTDKTIEEWGVELETSSALKAEKAIIEGMEYKIELHETHPEPYKNVYAIGVPKEYGIVIPKGGAQRVYFKLRAEKPKTTYEISGVLKSEITGDVPIRAKEFKYLCDAGVSPEAVKAELKKTFSEKEAARLALSFKTVQELDRMCDREAKTDEYMDKLLVLKNYTEGFSDTFTKKVDEFSRFMVQEQGEYLEPEYKGKVRRFCTNLVDVWISEFLKG